MKLSEIPLGQVQLIVILVGMIIVGGWNSYKFYDEARSAHIEAKHAYQAVEKLTSTIEAQQSTILMLQVLQQQERDMQELDSFRSRLDTLKPYEKVRYCQLFTKYRGSICDAP